MQRSPAGALALALALTLPLALLPAHARAADNICGTNATLGAHVMAALNLSFPGLEAVAAAESRGDLGAACEALAAYYSSSNGSFWLRIPPVAPGTGRVGNGSLVDNAVDLDLYYLAGVTTQAVVPRNADGGLDWLDKGPRNDVEFMNCLNRFDVFGWLLAAYRQTGNPVYTRYFDATVIDWATHNPCPNALSGGAPCSPQGVAGVQCAWGAADAPGAQACATGTFESPWRSLEMGIRTDGVFASAFYGFQRAAEFSTSARALLVLAMGEHNAALSVDGGHPGMGTPNWEMGQWSGLITSCVTFPELRNTSGLIRQALAELQGLLADGVYPDGVETELASGYDSESLGAPPTLPPDQRALTSAIPTNLHVPVWTASEFLGVLQTLAYGKDTEPPQAFADHVEKMWNYGAFVTDPAGCLPRNGDSDLCGGGFSDAATAYFGREDWVFIQSQGARGVRPANLSMAFPWAGQVVMRSGFAAKSTHAWFDVGPYGSSGHAHRDKLGLNLHAKGAMLLVDSGRFAYAGTDLSATLHRLYGPNTTAHNTLTFDGADQLPLPALADAPVPASSFSFGAADGGADWAFGSMSLYDTNVLQGAATHTRAVYYQRAPAADADGDFLLVVDRVDGDRARLVQATWHAHPNSTGVSVDVSGGAAVVGGVETHSGQPVEAQACIYAAVGLAAQWSRATVVSGVVANASTGARWQGWYSQSYDDAWPAPTLVYERDAAAPGTVFAWLIVPQAARGPCAGDDAATVTSSNATAVVLDVTVAGRAYAQVVVPLGT